MSDVSAALDPVTTRISSLVPDRTRVLCIARSVPTGLLRLLLNRDCRLTLVTSADGDADCEVIRGRPDQAEVLQRLAGSQFDVLIVSDMFSDGREAETLLKSLQPRFTDGGFLVAVVPCVTAGVAGGQPGYTQAGLEDLMAGCGLAIGVLDEVDSPIAAGFTNGDGRTTHFVIGAFPASETHLNMLRARLHALAVRAELVEREVRALREARADLDQRLAVCQKQRDIRDEALNGARERAVRQQELIDALHAQIQQERTDAANRQAVIDRLQASLEQHRVDLSREMDASRAARRHVEQLTRSYSWIVTAPLRAVGRRLGMGPR